MTVKTIPLDAVAFQKLTCSIEGKAVTLSIRQLGSSIYTDLAIDGEQINQGVRAVNGGSVMPYPHHQFSTNIYWKDAKGDTDPRYDGLGDRYFLLFEESDE